MRAAAVFVLALAWAGPARAGGAVAPGAYCPLPEAGARPKCLEPAVARYGEFFQAVEDGRAGDARLDPVEAAVAGADDYLALSSLAYGYYRLSQQAARTAEADPEIAARLERWNALLARAYGADPEAATWRDAVRAAALDLKRRAPPVELQCRGTDGAELACTSTDAALQSLDRRAGDVGFRGGLERLLERVFGRKGS